MKSMNFVTIGVFSSSILMTTGFMATEANAVDLITNGGFETGDFSGWTIFDAVGGSGSFFIEDNDGITPLSGHPTVGPASGNFFAVSDQIGAGAHALLQTFTVPTGTSQLTLSFDMFINDLNGAGAIIDPAGLDFTAVPNQHARVDLLSAAADPLDTGAGVLANFFLDSDTPGPNPYTPFAFDLTPFVGGGGTYQLRFAEVDNQFFFNQGIDNVRLEARAVSVPEPGTGLGLSVSVALGAGILLKRNQYKSTGKVQ